MTPTKENDFVLSEVKRLAGVNPVYYVYEGNRFTGAHETQKDIDLTDESMVFECDKVKRESHRIW